MQRVSTLQTGRIADLSSFVVFDPILLVVRVAFAIIVHKLFVKLIFGRGVLGRQRDLQNHNNGKTHANAIARACSTYFCLLSDDLASAPAPSPVLTGALGLPLPEPAAAANDLASPAFAASVMRCAPNSKDPQVKRSAMAKDSQNDSDRRDWRQRAGFRPKQQHCALHTPALDSVSIE